MSKNLQQVQVGSGVITPDKLFTDNILETRLKAAEEAKMLDKRLAAAEKEGELSRALTKGQYEAQNQLARDKLAADVEDQTARLGLLRDQDTRQAALHGIQIGEAGMKLDKLARADAAERAYVSAISNPETLRQKAVKSTDGYRELEAMQKAVDSNMAEFKSYIDSDLKKEQEQAAKNGKQVLTPDEYDKEVQKRLEVAYATSKSALPSVLNPDTRTDEYTQNKIYDTLKGNADKQQLRDATRTNLAKTMGTAPTEEQVDAVLGNIGVDYASQQKAMDDKYSEQVKGITGILRESINPSVIGRISSKSPTSGLDIKDVTDSGLFTDGKKEFTNAIVGAKVLAEQNPEAIPSKYLDAALSYAAYKGVKGADDEGKVKFSMSPEDLFIAAREALPMVMNSEKSTGQQFSPQQALSMLKEMYAASPNARTTYGSRISNTLYGDSGSNLPKADPTTTVASSKIGSTYDDYMQSNARSYGKALQDEGMAPDMARIEQLLGTDLKKGQVYQDYVKDYIINRNPDLPIENMTLEQVQEKVLPGAISALKSRIANAVGTVAGDGANADTSEADAFYNRLIINGRSPTEARVARDNFINNRLGIGEMKKELQRLEAYRQ